jgi:antirestriction protein ArdC
MASAFMQMELGFSLTEAGMKEHTEKHAAYVQSWLKHLKEDYKELYQATRDAVKTADYVLRYGKAVSGGVLNRWQAGYMTGSQKQI